MLHVFSTVFPKKIKDAKNQLPKWILDLHHPEFWSRDFNAKAKDNKQLEALLAKFLQNEPEKAEPAELTAIDITQTENGDLILLSGMEKLALQIKQFAPEYQIKGLKLEGSSFSLQTEPEKEEIAEEKNTVESQTPANNNAIHNETTKDK